MNTDALVMSTLLATSCLAGYTGFQYLQNSNKDTAKRRFALFAASLVLDFALPLSVVVFHRNAKDITNTCIDPALPAPELKKAVDAAGAKADPGRPFTVKYCSFPNR